MSQVKCRQKFIKKMLTAFVADVCVIGSSKARSYQTRQHLPLVEQGKKEVRGTI